MQQNEIVNATASYAPAAWCLVDLDGSTIRACIIHIGRGKFRIVQDELRGKHAGRIVDASDVFSCEV